VCPRDVIRELAGCDDPGDPPADHPLLPQNVADRDRPIAHTGEGSRMDDLAAVEQHAFVIRPVDEPEIVAGHDLDDRLPFLVRYNPTAGERRVVHEDGTGPVGYSTPQAIRVEAPPAVDDPQGHEARDGAHQSDAVDHACVRRVGHDDLVARVRDAVQRVEQRHTLPGDDDDLSAAVIPRAATPLDERRDGVLQVVAARKRQPAVRLIIADGRLSRIHSGGRRRNVRIEVLQTEHVRIVAGRRRDTIDTEAGDLFETPNAHWSSARLRCRSSVTARSVSSRTGGESRGCRLAQVAEPSLDDPQERDQFSVVESRLERWPGFPNRTLREPTPGLDRGPFITRNEQSLGRSSQKT
jgi:hypothetical protein